MKSIKKFLFLMEPEEEFPEQLNSYMFLIMEMILLAKKTSRTMVLPMLHSQPRNNTIAEAGEIEHRKFIIGKLIFQMESIFDQKKLNEYVETVTFADFVKISGQKISTLCCFANPHHQIIESYGKKFYCQRILNIRNIDEMMELSDPFIGITGYRRGKYAVSSSPNWPNNLDKDYWEIRTHLRYHKKLYEKANNFIRKNKLKNYLAVHWRRGDRVHPEMTTLQEKNFVNKKQMMKEIDNHLIYPIKKIMRERKLYKVFLATNSGTKWHLDYLKKKLPIIQYPPSGSWKTREVESIIEQIICTKANFFFGAPGNRHGSSFTRWIVDSMIISGKGNQVAYQTKIGSDEKFLSQKRGIISQIRDWILRLLIPIIKLILKSFKRVSRLQLVLSKIKIINANLFDRRFVRLDTRSLQVGGSWIQSKDGSKLKTNDPILIKILNESISKAKNPVIYDIGASTGSFSMLAKFNPKAHFYAFEPQPNVFDILEQNIRINNLSNRVTTFQIALSDKNTVLPLQVPTKISQSGLATLGAPLRFASTRTISVASATLDDFTKQFTLPDPTHIKIDTEGAELLVLRGGKNLIKRKKPILILECDEKNTVQFGYHSNQIITLLVNLGYVVDQLASRDIVCTPK